jgi:hypothetical protein
MPDPKNKKQQPPKKKPIYVESENDPRYRAYQDSLSLYNKGVKERKELKNINETIIKSYNKQNSVFEADATPTEKIGNYKNTPINPKHIIKGISPVYPIEQRYEFGIGLSTDENPTRHSPSKGYVYDKNGSFVVNLTPFYKKPTQPILIKNNTVKDSEGNTYDYDENEYNKKHPPIYLTDPNDSRIGLYTEKGNKYLYKKPTQPILINPPQERKPLLPTNLTPQEANINNNIEAEIPNINQDARIPRYYNVTTKGGGWLGGWENTQKVIDPNNISEQFGDKVITPVYALGGMLNKYAQGGQLNTTNTNNMLNEFNEGGLHEQNKLGGIPQGMGQNQQMNTVEEGETKKDNFIYSNRIRLTEDIVNQFSLPKTLANKTVAEATKIINNKFEGRNSKIDNSTKKAMLDRIAEAQETIKQVEEAKQAEIAQSMQANSQEVPDMMEGQVPQGMEEFMQPQQQMAGGGSLQGQQNAELGANITHTAADMFVPGAGQMLKSSDQLGSSVGTMIGGKHGEQIGQMISPLGTFKGGITAATTGNLNDIPGIGLFGGSTTKQKEQHKQQLNQDLLRSNQMTSNFAYGGKVNKYFGGGPIPQQTVNYLKSLQNVPNMQNTIQSARQSEGVNASMFTETNVPMTFGKGKTFGPQPTGHTNYQRFKNATDKTGKWIGDATNKTGNFINENGANALRYTPAVINAFQLNQHNKRGYDTVNPMINNIRYNPQYMDERALTNQINAESNYAGNALANASNGSLGMLSNNILASQLNKTRGLSDAYSRVADVNRNENRTGQQFNLGVDEANLARRINAEDMTARNKGAFLTEQSKLRAQIGNDLGNIGKEGVYKKLVKEGFGYTYDGKYVTDNQGNKVINPETNQPITKKEMEKMTGKKKDYKAMFSSMNRDFETTLKNK